MEKLLTVTDKSAWGLGVSVGPLIDNEGFVIGVTSWGHKVKQYNGAMSLDGFCAKILKCGFEYKGEKTWWDYSGD